jgi:tRNA(adenine34) deaminase
MALSEEKQEELVRTAMKLAEETATEGNLPFAALLIDKSGTVIIAGKNTVNSANNAAAHAEINILYEAGKKLGTNDLSDYALVSNAASCPMCVTAMIKAKITDFYYGAPNEGTMVPNISMDKVVEAIPFEVEVHGGILEEAAREQIAKLAKRY